MKNLRFSFAFMALLATTALFAQTNLGVDYYLLGNNVKAKAYFEKEIAANPAEAYFYLGEIAFSEADFQKAGEFYNKAAAADAKSVYPLIGLAKLQSKSDAKTAEATLNGIARKYKSDIDIVLAVGRAFLDAGMNKQAEKTIAAAKKINSKNPSIYILEGDLVYDVRKGITEKAGEAGGKYEMSNYFDPNFALGYVKTAQIYQTINPPLATSKLETIIEKQPDYLIAYGMLGRLYAQRGFYDKSIEAFKNYFNAGIYSTEDFEMYVRSNYFSDNFEQAAKIAKEALRNNPDHFVLNRLLMYVNAKAKLSDEGLETARKFFSLRADSGYIGLDYSMYALILDNAKRYDEAFAQYDKAINMEPDNLEIYTDATATARRMKNYALAADYLKMQMKKKAALAGNADFADDAADISALGYDYYSAGTTILKNAPLVEELMKKREVINLLSAMGNVNAAQLASDAEYFGKVYSLYYLQQADATFDILIERVPDSYTGYRFKALTKHAINDNIEEGLARPYYEKVADLIDDKGELSAANKRVLLEAYNYLGYYYYMKNDKPNTILYWSKVLEIDPNNDNAKKVIEAMENEGK